MVVNHLDSSLRVETLSFEEAADFNPQGRSIYFVPFNLGGRQWLGRRAEARPSELVEKHHPPGSVTLSPPQADSG